MGETKPVVADEAMETAFADWLQCAGSQPGCELVTHEAGQATWWAALEWAARQQPTVTVCVEGGALTEAEWNKLGDRMKVIWGEWRASLLR